MEVAVVVVVEVEKQVLVGCSSQDPRAFFIATADIIRPSTTSELEESQCLKTEGAITTKNVSP